MYQYLALVFLFLGVHCADVPLNEESQPESSNGAHSLSLSYLKTPNLLNNKITLENILKSFGALDSKFFESANTFLETVGSKLPNEPENSIVQLFKNGGTVLKFFQSSTNPSEENASSKPNSEITEALGKFLSKLEEESVDVSKSTNANQQYLQQICSDVKKIGTENIQTLNGFLYKAIQQLKNDPTNLIFTALVDMDITMAICENAKSTGELASPSTGEKDEIYATAIQHVLPKFLVEMKVASEFAKVLQTVSA